MVAEHDALIAKLATRVEECLKEAGVAVEVHRNEHGITIAARDIQATPVRFVAHLSDHDVLPQAHGVLAEEISRTQLSQMAARPTLAQRSSSAPERPRIPATVERIVKPSA